MTPPNDAIIALQKFAISDVLDFETDAHGLVRAQITSPLCEATIYLHGAHLTHWQPRGEDRVLFLSRQSEFAPDRPIRGGVPVIFPWFGPKVGETASHGWARRQTWNVESSSVSNSDGAVEIVLGLDSTAVTEAAHPCTLRLHVSAGPVLRIELEVTNTGGEALHYEEALHSYFEVGDIHEAKVEGLGGAHFFDKTQGATPGTGVEPLGISSEIDRVYPATESTVIIVDDSLARRIWIEKSHSHATVVWNPWIAKAAALPDFGDDEWTRMLCVETANIGDSGVVLQPGETHRMGTTMRVKRYLPLP